MSDYTFRRLNFSISIFYMFEILDNQTSFITFRNNTNKIDILFKQVNHIKANQISDHKRFLYRNTLLQFYIKVRNYEFKSMVDATKKKTK